MNQDTADKYMTSKEVRKLLTWMSYTTFHSSIKEIDPNAFQVKENGNWTFNRKAVMEFLARAEGNGNESD